MTASALISSSRSILSSPSATRWSSTAPRLRAYIWLACSGIPAGRLSVPTMVTPVAHDRLAGLGQLAVAAGLGRQVDDHRSRPHRLDGRGGDQPRRRPAGHERGRDDDVGVGDVALEQLLLLRLLLGGERGGVAALVLRAGHLELELHERRPQALHLLLHDRPRVERRHDGAEAAGGGDRLQAGHAGAEDEHLGGRDRAGGGHQHGEELRQRLGGEDHRPVARRPWPATRARPSAGRASPAGSTPSRTR